ncbi:universal stress protein [Microlunatus ginsengisoli]|uniref:Universal stress protein n=1 Tax=Microlunatus ginsengisoli TaxID=363863 RepID=A0ABP7A094_9ACTN
MGEIVVGVDLSDAGVAALRWAAAQARVTGASLRGIHVLKLPDAFALAGLVGAAVETPVESINAGYRQALTAVWQSVDPDDSWSLEYVVDDPRGVLAEASKQASLIVVGTGSSSGLERLISGSVSHYILNHSHCPVVAVPAG